MRKTQNLSQDVSANQMAQEENHKDSVKLRFLSFHSQKKSNLSTKILIILTLARPIGLPPHAPVAQKMADQR